MGCILQMFMLHWLWFSLFPFCPWHLKMLPISTIPMTNELWKNLIVNGNLWSTLGCSFLDFAMPVWFFSAIGIPTVLVSVALIVGKCFGVFFFGYIALKIGFALPKGMRKRDLVVAGLVAGVGLTVALFICNSAFSDPVLQGSAKMGALFSIASIPIAMVVARLLGVQKYREGQLNKPYEPQVK